jgi:hypothetical protein
MEILTSASAAAAAQAMIQSRICPNTNSIYTGKIKTITKFFIRKQYLLGSQKLPIPLPTDQILEFFGSLLSESTRTAAFQTIRGYKSALVWYYTGNGAEIPSEQNIALESFLQGYKRKIATMKDEGQMAVFEGKHHLTFKGYNLLAKKFFHLTPQSSNNNTSNNNNINRNNKSHNSWNQMLFSWCFLLLQWNLIARSASVASIKLEHISWQNDSLIISIPKHKGDQAGAQCFPRHVYANPLNPVICPILSLAVYIFCKPFLHDYHQTE